HCRRISGQWVSRRHTPACRPPKHEFLQTSQTGGSPTPEHALPCAYRGCGQNETPESKRGVPGVRVLVVEDERVLADAIATGLRREAMAVDVAYDGGGALERTSYIDYDVIVLDRDLPVVHGDQVCRKLVEQRTASRILMLTASGDVDDKVEGLGLGADDY